MEIYVDQAGIFTGHKDDSVTRIGHRLKFYDVSFIVANTPEAKGKVERIHQVWQDRLPPYFALNGLTPASDVEEVNRHIHALRQHRNRRERHRELGMTPQTAWDQAMTHGAQQAAPRAQGTLVELRLVPMESGCDRCRWSCPLRTTGLSDAGHPRHQSCSL